MSNIPTQEPGSLNVGDTWRWTRSLADYPAGTWTLKYRFKSATGGFEVVASASGTTHSVSVSAATTAGFTAGDYTWTAWVEGGSSEKYTVDSGACQLLADYRSSTASTALDDRGHAKKMLDAIEAWLESRDPAVAGYKVAGREMQYVPISELIKLRSRYKLEVQGEVNASKLARGEGAGRKIQFRL